MIAFGSAWKGAHVLDEAARDCGLQFYGLAGHELDIGARPGIANRPLWLAGRLPPVVVVAMPPVRGMPGVSILPAALIALRPPVRVSRTIILAVGARIELSAFARIGYHLLGHSWPGGKCTNQQDRSTQRINFVHFRLSFG